MEPGRAPPRTDRRTLLSRRLSLFFAVLLTLGAFACAPTGLIEVRQVQPIATHSTNTLLPTVTPPAPPATSSPTATSTLAHTPAPAPTDTPSPAPTQPPVESAAVPPADTIAHVVRVVDGDTIEVNVAGEPYTLRYIGIDTPEIAHSGQPLEPFGPEASSRNSELVLDRDVRLEKDVSETDYFGRLLRYVWIGDTLINEQLVREGYAHASRYPPDVRHQDRLAAAEREALELSRGLWSITPESPSAPAGEPLSAAFVADLSIPDDTEMQPGQAFTKSWQLRNDGNTPWPAGCTVAHVMADDFGVADAPLTAAVQPGETVEIALPMTAPTQSGTFESWWQIKSPDGQSVGKAFYTRIRVAETDAGAVPAAAAPVERLVDVPAAAVQPTATSQPAGGGCPYIGNVNTMKFHRANCASVDQMSESNKVCLTSREEAIARGFVPCQKCNP